MCYNQYNFRVIGEFHLAIYSTKTNKLNQKRKRLSIGSCLILFFAVMLLLVICNFFEIFTITILGTFGLLFYPISIFMIVVGILICADKPFRASKPLLIVTIIWILLFVLIMQMLYSILTPNLSTSHYTLLSTTNWHLPWVLAIYLYKD